ncbi:MAG TPA: hypothetical protein PKX38_03855 [Alphaproteobacteria bacterium]|nr:hypothetical protein [Alphaproteobacteria bacterium]
MSSFETNIRRDLETPRAHDGFPALFIKVPLMDGNQSRKQIFMNLALVSPERMLKEFDNHIAAAQYYDSYVSLYYLPAIDPLFEIPDCYGGALNQLLTMRLDNPHKTEKYTLKARAFFEEAQEIILSEYTDETHSLLHDIDIKPTADEHGYDLVMLPEDMNGEIESPEEWQKRTIAVARHLGAIFAGVAHVADSTFENGRIILLSDHFPSLKKRMDLITNCDNPSLLIE